MATTTMQEPGRGMPSSAEQAGGARARTAMVRLPFVTAQFCVPEVDVGSAVRVVRSWVPTPQRAVYYGDLAALVASSVIGWPVAAAIGVGTAIARREVIDHPQRRAMDV
jgi:hypothetical protein